MRDGLEDEDLKKQGSAFGISFTKKSQVSITSNVRTPGNINGISSSLLATSSKPSAASGRRKSTPAALDMALRTAEGKAAIDELIKGEAGTKKQMMFGQYFGATPAAAGAGTSAKLSAAPPMDAPRAPRPGRAAAALAVATHEYEFLQAGKDKAISTVMEDEDQMPGSPSPQPSPSGAKSSATQFPKDHASATVAPAPHLPHSATASTKPSYEVDTSGRPKMLALSKDVPLTMSRKSWGLGDYVIGRKMYTGYASTVYQVGVF